MVPTGTFSTMPSPAAPLLFEPRHAARAAPCTRVEAEMHQRIVLLARFHQHIAATPAIPPEGPPRGTNFFPAKGHAAVASAAGSYSYLGFVYEHCDLLPSPFVLPAPAPAIRAEERKKPRMTRLHSTIAELACQGLFNTYRTSGVATKYRLRQNGGRGLGDSMFEVDNEVLGDFAAILVTERGHR